MDELTISILAGGKSSRMGEDKGLMTLFGQPMIEYVIHHALDVTDNIQIITANEQYKKFGYPLVADKYENKGPLGGLQAALTASQTEENLILSCDMPYTKSGLLRYILLQTVGFDITITAYQDRLHPFPGVYQKGCLTAIEDQLKKRQLKITELFRNLEVNLVAADEFDAINFKNLNAKEDIVRFK